MKLKIFKSGLLIVVAVLPSLLMFCFVPPLWNGVDSIIYLTSRGSCIPLFPPLYPLFCHGIIKNFVHQVESIYIIISIQHLLYILALFYCSGVFEFRKRFTFLILMGFCMPALLSIHGIYSEAFVCIFELVFLGSFLRIATNTAANKSHLLVYFLSLFGMLLSRYSSIFFTPLLVLYAILNLRSQKLRSGLFKTLKLSFFTIATVICSYFIQYAVSTFIGQFNFATYGRPICSKIDELPWSEMTEIERNEILHEYKAATEDTITRQVFDMLSAKNSVSWAGTFIQIDSVIKASESPISFYSDYYLNQVSRIFLTHPNKYSLSLLSNSIKRTILESGLVVSFLQVTVKTIQDNLYNSKLDEIRKHISYRGHLKKVKALIDNRFITICNKISTGALIFLIAFVFFIKKPLNNSRLCNMALSIFVTSVFYIVIVSAIALPIWRYALPPYLAFWILGAFMIADKFIGRDSMHLASF